MDLHKKYFDLVQMSCRLLAKSLYELRILNEPKQNRKEADLVQFLPFKFYRVSLQYMIVMEFTKLLEPDTKDKKNSEREKLGKIMKKLTLQVYQKFPEK